MSTATISVKVQASARRDELGEIRDGVLLARVSAPPLEGRANEAVRRLLAKRLGVPQSRVVIVRGQRSRIKIVRLDGIDQAAVDALLNRS